MLYTLYRKKRCFQTLLSLLISGSSKVSHLGFCGKVYGINEAVHYDHLQTRIYFKPVWLKVGTTLAEVSHIEFQQIMRNGLQDREIRLQSYECQVLLLTYMAEVRNYSTIDGSFSVSNFNRICEAVYGTHEKAHLWSQVNQTLLSTDQEYVLANALACGHRPKGDSALGLLQRLQYHIFRSAYIQAVR